MKFKLPQQTTNNSINSLIFREIKYQKIALPRASKNNLKELSELTPLIETRGLPPYFVCKKLPNNLGHGLFLHPKAKPILKGRLIAPYAGEISLTPQNDSDHLDYAFAPLSDVLLTKEEQILLDKKRKWHPRRRYMLNIDALKKGNFTRFINHSEKPNVQAEILKIPVNEYGIAPSPLEIFYLAKKTIYPGEQLLISYEDGEESYWAPLGIKPFPITPKTFQLSPSLRVVRRDN